MVCALPWPLARKEIALPPGPLISVAMAVRNGMPFLPEALESLARQTIADFEIVFVDDGSTDHSAAVAREIGGARLRLIGHAATAGLAASLNEALGVARGTYIARMDADDVCLPMRFQRQVEFLEAHPEVGILGTAFEVIDGRGVTLGVYHPPLSDAELRWYSLLANPFAHPSVMLRKHILETTSLRYPDFEVAQDYALWVRVLEFTQGANLPEPLLRYRSHAESTSRAKRELQRERHNQVSLEAIRRELPALPISLSEVRDLHRLFVERCPLGDDSRRGSVARLYLRLAVAFLRSRGGANRSKILYASARSAAQAAWQKPRRRGWWGVMAAATVAAPRVVVDVGDWGIEGTGRRLRTLLRRPCMLRGLLKSYLPARGRQAGREVLGGVTSAWQALGRFASRTRFGSPVPCPPESILHSRTGSPFKTHSTEGLAPPIVQSLQRYAAALQTEYVCRLRGPLVIEGRHGWTVTPAGRLLRESMPYAVETNVPYPSLVDLLLAQGRATALPEVLSVRYEWVNYWHFLNDILGQLLLADRIGVPAGIPVLISQRVWELPYFQAALRRSASLGRRQWRVLGPRECVEAGVAYFCKNMPNEHGLFRELAKLLEAPEPPRGTERSLFLARGPGVRRRLANSWEIESLATAAGFEVIDCAQLSLDDQVRIFSEARFVAGVHGAALANLIFRQGAPLTVLELFPRGGIPPHYFWMSRELGYRYLALVGSPETKGHFYVDEAEFKQALAGLTQ